MSPEERLFELGIDLPGPADTPLHAAPQAGASSTTVSATCPATATSTASVGVGEDIDLERAALAARTTAHLMCHALREELGSLDRVDRWLKVLVLVRSAPGFGEQPAVANGFTNAIAELWGEDRGICARSAIGVSELPGGLAVEVEALVAIID